MSLGARSSDQDLGDILLAAHLIDEAALTKARRESMRISRPLWRILTRDSLVSEDALFRALRQEVRVPVLAADQLKSVVMPEELRAAMPQDVAQHLGILPLERSTDGRRAVLAMVDPTADITPIWPALSRLGVVEVRRFLVHLGTLRLGLEFFYGLPWQPESADLSAALAQAQAVEVALSRSALTQPMPPPAAAAEAEVESASVIIDPGLQEEFVEMEAPTDPGSAGRPSATSLGRRRSVPPASPAHAAQPPPPRVAPSPLGRRDLSLLPELPASEVLLVDEQPIELDPSALTPEKEPVQEALIKAGEGLAAMLEAELGTRRPEALSRLAQGVAERLGFAPRAVRELMLVTRLYGLLRFALLRRGPLPPPCQDVLGFEAEHPLMTALRELQSVLVDFIRLPTEPDLVPMGARIVLAVIEALALLEKQAPAQQGRDETLEAAPSEAFLTELRARVADTALSGALSQVIELDLPALGIEPGRLEVPPPAEASYKVADKAAPASLLPAEPPAPPSAEPPAPPSAPPGILLLSPLPVSMPGVAWQTGPDASITDEGLLPYTPQDRWPSGF